MVARRLRNLIHTSWAWLRCPALPFAERLVHYPRLVTSLGRSLAGGSQRITYLGRPFEYDNRLIPFLLQLYPDLITRCILENAEGPIEHVLDIGGNLGQFATTVNALMPDSKSVDVFEANPEIFEQLERNTEGLKKVRPFNLAVGPAGTGSFFFTPTKSVIGSAIRENAVHRPDSEVRELQVQFVDDLAAITGRSVYDLIKVDVEGFEFEVMKSLTGLSARYMFIEVTGPAKKKTYRTSELYGLIADRFGPFEIRYQDASSTSSSIFEILLEFEV